MYKNILLPTKGSQGCQEAVVAGLKLAKALGAKVTILNVQPKLSVFEILEAYHPDQRFISSERDAREAQESMAKVEKLHKAAGDHFVDDLKKLADEQGVTADTLVLDKANPEQGIFKAAKDKGCDLIFMASHTTTGIAGAILGSVTTKVVARSEIPVLVYRCS
jgi:nucleotide-binding universal stress UspA family protein